MTDNLLARVLEAHGGLEKWERVTELTAKLSLGGPFWEFRGWPDVYAGQTVTLETRRQRITFAPFTAPDRMSVLEVDPERVSIQASDDGFVFTTRRRVHLHNEAGNADQSFAPITLDVEHVTVR